MPSLTFSLWTDLSNRNLSRRSSSLNTGNCGSAIRIMMNGLTLSNASFLPLPIGWIWGGGGDLFREALPPAEPCRRLGCRPVNRDSKDDVMSVYSRISLANRHYRRLCLSSRLFAHRTCVRPGHQEADVERSPVIPPSLSLRCVFLEQTTSIR